MKKDRLDDSENNEIKKENTYPKKEDIEPYTRNERPINSKPPKGFNKMTASNIKRVSISVISALLIGSLLGFIMIKMITNIDVSVDHRVDDFQGKIEDNENSDSGVEALDGYVLQVGVFSEMSNAEKWSEKFNQAGIQTVIWKKEENFFLLAGIASAEEQAKMSAEKIKDSGFDVFVKEWEATKISKKLSTEEQQWVTSFIQVWKETLGAITKQEFYLADGWNELIDHYPDESGEIKQVIEIIKGHVIQDLASMGEQQKEYVLLDIWQHYETIFN